jgi:hypothetical protein
MNLVELTQYTSNEERAEEYLREQEGSDLTGGTCKKGSFSCLPENNIVKNHSGLL